MKKKKRKKKRHPRLSAPIKIISTNKRQGLFSYSAIQQFVSKVYGLCLSYLIFVGVIAETRKASPQLHKVVDPCLKGYFSQFVVV